jgi:hypothetical protein
VFAAAHGWTHGASGTVRSIRLTDGTRVRLQTPISAAWTASPGVRYLNRPGEDPPNRTIADLRRGQIVVWAVIQGSKPLPPPLRLRLASARRLRCCEGATPPYPYVWELAGRARRRRYELIVRVYFGSQPTNALVAAGQRALGRLRLP